MALIPQGGLRARVLPRFPANLIAGNGISIIKNGQSYVFSIAEGFLVDGDKGDIVVSNGGVTWTIEPQAVTPTKLQHIPQSSFLSRSAAGTGVVQVLSSIDATAQLQIFTSALKGLVPASGGGTSAFLRADGQFATPPGGANPFPAGDDNEIQFGVGGEFAADSNFKWTAGAGMTTSVGVLITHTSPSLVVNKTTNGPAILSGNRNGTPRWRILLGNDVAEGGANAGSNFALERYSDAGSLLGTPISVSRATGLVSIGGVTIDQSGYIIPQGNGDARYHAKDSAGVEIPIVGSNVDNTYLRSVKNDIVFSDFTGNVRATLTLQGVNIGKWRWHQYTAGILVTDASGNVTADAAFAATKVNKAGDTMTGVLTSKGTTGTIASQTADPTPSSFQVINTTGAGNAAHMAFHRGGSFIGYFGIDTDNLWKVGGGSHGANAHQIWHAGSFDPTTKITKAGGDTMTGLHTYAPASAIPNYAMIITQSGNAFKWTHGSTNLFGSLGAKNISGPIFIALMAEHGSTNDTYRNSGQANAYGFVIQHNLAGQIDIMVSEHNTASTNFNGTTVQRITASTGAINFPVNIQSSSFTTGSIVVAGGIGVSGMVRARNGAYLSDQAGETLPILNGSSGVACIDFAGPGADNGIVFQHRNAGVAQALLFFNNSGGQAGRLEINGVTVALTSGSDERLKMNVVDFLRAKEVIQGLRPREFNWIENGNPDVGLIAQEANEIFPLAVRPGGDDYRKEPWTINYAALVPVLIAAVRELYDEVESLRRAA